MGNSESAQLSSHTTTQVASPPRVLVADDDPHIRRLLEASLRSDGYSVLSATDGHELVQMAQQYNPNLVLVDLMMPQMDGYEAIRQMRNDTRIGHIPMLILTARMRPDEIVVGFETGADDYIAKPFDISEVLARVRSHLRRAARQPLLNPLSGLPGGALIAQELQARFELGAPLALLHADLNNFKTFNDTYGFSRGDRAILLVSRLLQAAIASYGDSSDFIGHVGGDDFVILTTPERVEAICRDALAAFDSEVRLFYQDEDWQRGYLSGVDRFGILRRFRLLSLSIGGTTNRYRMFSGPDEMAQVAAEMKHYAKAQNGSSFAIDQRSIQQPRTIERRQIVPRRVVVASADLSLAALIHGTLQRAGYQVHEVPNVEALRHFCQNDGPSLIIADAQLGEPLQQLCDELAHATELPQVVVLTYDGANSFQDVPGLTTTLQMPLPLADIVTCIEQLAANTASS